MSHSSAGVDSLTPYLPGHRQCLGRWGVLGVIYMIYGVCFSPNFFPSQFILEFHPYGQSSFDSLIFTGSTYRVPVHLPGISSLGFSLLFQILLIGFLFWLLQTAHIFRCTPVSPQRMPSGLPTLSLIQRLLACSPRPCSTPSCVRVAGFYLCPSNVPPLLLPGYKSWWEVGRRQGLVPRIPPRHPLGSLGWFI